VLAGALGDLLVPGDHEANLSVVVGQTPSTLHRLLWGACTVARSRDPQRILRALDRHLGAHRPVPAELLRLDAVAAVGSRGALLLPPAARQQTSRLQGHLRKAGFELSDAPYAEVDPATGELVVSDPGLLDPSEVCTAAGLDRPNVDAGLAPGRHPILWWCMPSWDPEGPVDAVWALVQGAAQLRPRSTRDRAERLRQLVTSVPVRRIEVGDVRTALGPLDALLER
jgi:hypothetical protein